MRGSDEHAEVLSSYVSCEARVPAGHPLRAIRAIVDEALEVLSPELDRLYSKIGRPSIPPEKLLRALLLQAFYSVRSERQLMEQVDYNLLFRWFVGLSMDAPVWDVTVFTKNRDRLLAGDITAKVLAAVLAQPRVKALLLGGRHAHRSLCVHEELPAQGRGADAWRLRRRSGAASATSRGEKRTNETRASTTDTDARLYRKGRGNEAQLSFLGLVLMEEHAR